MKESVVKPDVSIPYGLRAHLERLASGADSGPESAVDLFAETFLALDPVRSVVVTREGMRAALVQRHARFAAAGIRTTRLETLKTRPLDDRHQLAETTWSAESDDPAAVPLVLGTTFLLRESEGNWSVVVYLNHDDIDTELARRTPR
jgi:hypothetical protein